MEIELSLSLLNVLHRGRVAPKNQLLETVLETVLETLGEKGAKNLYQ